MGTLKNKVAIIGEGPTEYYYIQSLADNFKGINIKPDYPKHTGMWELGKKISASIEEGHRYVFCVIDMDNKNVESEMKLYRKLKEKYKKPIIKKSKGIYCEVMFFESHLCTEIFFYFYFKYSSQFFDSQETLIKAFNKFCKYEKSTAFFRKCKGLHSYFEKNGGSIETAIQNADRSVAHRDNNGSDYTYSELSKMLKLLRQILPTNN